MQRSRYNHSCNWYSNFIKGEDKKDYIIDVGINRIDNIDNTKKVIVGDVDYEGAIKVCSAITPVPEV